MVDSCCQSDAESVADEKPTACEYHVKETRRRFAERLEALGCICKALLARNMDSCCTSKPPSVRGRSKRRSNISRSPMSSLEKDSCCASSSACDAGKENRSGKLNRRRRSPDKPAVANSSCCAAKRSSSCAEKDCCRSLNGSSDSSRLNVSKVPGTNTDEIDIERGPATLEHVALTVQGMTCTGCETKLSRSLRDIKSTTNIKTSLVLSRAEFDLDLGAISVEDAIAQLQKATGFSFESYVDKGQEMDILTPGDPHLFVKQKMPLGVTEMYVVNKNTVRICYDANVVGSRDLVENKFDGPLQLAPLKADPSLAAGNRHVIHVGILTIISIVLTIPVLVLAWAPLPKHEILYASISLALATIIQGVVARPFYPAALKALIYSRVIEMDLLIVLSTSTAYIFSVVAFGYLVAGHPLSTGEFFETSTLLITLIMVGRFVSAFARQKAVESISIRSLQPTTALLVTDEEKSHREIDARLLQYGDVFNVAPDSKVVTDGTVVTGTSEVDESMITGESVLIEKKVGSPVVAGSVNSSGSLNVRVNRLPGENTISAIASMVDEAKLSKPKTQELAEVVAGYFVPFIVTLSIITFATWIAVGIAVRGQPGSEAAIQAITYAIAVLIISCPCAIGLAVPMVIVIAGGVAAEHGLVFKTAECIETARKTTHVVFDKTGTLTQGKLDVTAEDYLKGPKEYTAALTLGLVSTINHPVSAAVTRYLKTHGITPTDVSDIKTVTSKGVEGRAGSVTICAGNSAWLQVESQPKVQTLLSQGCTVFCVTVNGELHAVFGLKDSLRPDASEVVSQLSSRGIEVSIVSGDDHGAVQSVASSLGIPYSNIKARCSPADKRKYIQEIMSNGNGTVIFCGDGTNDAVALAQATIGLHVNEGTDVAQSAADAVLVRPALGGVLILIDLSCAVYRRICFNFGWSGVYNLFAILLAAGAFVDARIPPAYAGLGELVSVLPVIAIALQLKWAKFSKV